MSASLWETRESRSRWTWEDGVQTGDGEWIERPSLVLAKVTTKRRLRRHSLVSSVGSGSLAGSGSVCGDSRTATLFGRATTSFASHSERMKTEDARTVTLEDVKAVAVKLISSDLLKRMKTSTAVTFDEFYRTEAMNQFLWSVLLYFNAFSKHKEASSDENISIQGVLGDEARVTLSMAEQELAQASVNLGEQYCRLSTGQSHMSLHHTCQGSLRASRTHRDQHLFEAVYEFAMFVTWITFGYKDWNSIHKELGRLFKTRAFNRDMRVRGEGTVEFVEELGCKMDRKSNEYVSYRVLYDRPPQGNLRELRSPALQSYFASPKERQAWAFEPPYHPKSKMDRLLPSTISPPEKLGVIGELMSKVDPENLKYKVDEEEEEEDEEEEEEEGTEEAQDSISNSSSVLDSESDLKDS